MMTFTATATATMLLAGVALVLLVAGTPTASAQEVIALTDATFEHETQASTGSTTGSWFVKFYAPWCGYCKKIAPIWEDLAKDLAEHPINIAEVDCTTERATCSRFGIRGYPTLKFFHNGNMYSYKGSRDVTSFRAFVLGGYEDADNESTPSADSILRSAMNKLEEIVISTTLHDDPTINAILIGILIALAIVVPFFGILSVILCVCGGDPEAEGQRDAAEKSQKAKQSDDEQEDEEESKKQEKAKTQAKPSQKSPDVSDKKADADSDDDNDNSDDSDSDDDDEPSSSSGMRRRNKATT